MDKIKLDKPSKVIINNFVNSSFRSYFNGIGSVIIFFLTFILFYLFISIQIILISILIAVAGGYFIWMSLFWVSFRNPLLTIITPKKLIFIYQWRKPKEFNIEDIKNIKFQATTLTKNEDNPSILYIEHKKTKVRIGKVSLNIKNSLKQIREKLL